MLIFLGISFFGAIVIDPSNKYFGAIFFDLMFGSLALALGP